MLDDGTVHAEHDVVTDSETLMYNAVCAEIGTVADSDVPRNRGTYRHLDFIPYQTVMRNMAINHEVAIVSYKGIFLYRRSVN